MPLRALAWLLLLASNCSNVVSGIRQPPAFVTHRRGPRTSLAFVDGSDKELQTALSSLRAGGNTGMASSKKDNVGDAEAYAAMTSAAVDFSSVYERNGVVAATRSVRDIDTNSRRQFLYHIPVGSSDAGQPPFLAPPVELPPKIKARIPSPSGAKIAILVEESPHDGDKAAESKRHVFEIWTENGHRLAKRIVLSPETHGKVCVDFAWFGGVSWSPDESALVYTAEVNKPKTASFFATPSVKGEDTTNVGGQHTLGVGKSEDWGEKYGNTALLSLYCLNVDTGNIGHVENVPGELVAKCSASKHDGYVLGQPIFSPSGKSVVYVGWDGGEGGDMPRRLGAIYCFHRPCKLYSSPVGGLLDRLADAKGAEGAEGWGKDAPFVCLTPNDRLARSPRFSAPKGGKARLAYLCNTKGFDTHGGCMALRVADWDMSRGVVIDGSTKVVVDVVQLPGERKGDDIKVDGLQFPGLFLHQLRDRCFSPDGRSIVLTTEWGSVNKMVTISLEDGVVTPIHFDVLSGSRVACKSSSQQFLGFADDGGAIVTQSESNRPTILGYLPPSFLKEGQNAAASQILADLHPVASTSATKSGSLFGPGAGYSYRTMTIQPEHGDVKVPVGAVLLLPDNSGSKEKLPLIVVPHGGPHTCMSTSYIPTYGYLCKHGQYAVLHVNFRGSTGFGQAALESLAGTAGSLDVLDVVAATRAVIDEGNVDPERVGICGGSHGGFLASHCIGQHPDLFKVAAMRNPCTNIATMVTATDIPDWCYVETLGTGHYDFSHFRAPSREELSIMWDKSPIAHIEHVKAPMLMALGMKDRRVPPSQGIEYYHALRAKGVPTKLLVYEDCDHAIDLVANEADFWLNTKLWFDEHL